MSLSVAYRGIWLPGVTKARPNFDGGFRDWIRGKDWYPVTKITKKKAAIPVYDQNSLVDSFVNDFIMQSIVAFESASTTKFRQSEPKGCAWQAISYYYAAYFAANAIMRLSGHFCTNLEVDTCTEINERAFLVGLGGADEKSKIPPAIYYGRVVNNNGMVVHLESLSGVRGGVHAQFWNGFLRFLDSIRADINATQLPSGDKKDAIVHLNYLKESITRDGRNNGSWLSEVRNSINYRFEKGVWYPYINSEIDGSVMLKSMRDGLIGRPVFIDQNANVSDCQRMASISSNLLSWVKSSLDFISENAKADKKNKIKNGALMFHDEILK